jgi:hypothetical protein
MGILLDEKRSEQGDEVERIYEGRDGPVGEAVDGDPVEQVTEAAFAEVAGEHGEEIERLREHEAHLPQRVGAFGGRAQPRVGDQAPAEHLDEEQTNGCGEQGEVGGTGFELRGADDQKWEDRKRHDVELPPEQDEEEQGEGDPFPALDLFSLATASTPAMNRKAMPFETASVLMMAACMTATGEAARTAKIHLPNGMRRTASHARTRKLNSPLTRMA